MKGADNSWKPFNDLLGFVRLVLLVDWDPIGILGYPGAIDEYDSYADQVCELIHSGATREDLIGLLDGIEKKWMNLPGERRAQGEVADKLLRAHARIEQYNRWRPEE